MGNNQPRIPVAVWIVALLIIVVLFIALLPIAFGGQHGGSLPTWLSWVAKIFWS